MKLDRNINRGLGKYALLKLRELDKVVPRFPGAMGIGDRAQEVQPTITRWDGDFEALKAAWNRRTEAPE